MLAILYGVGFGLQAMNSFATPRFATDVILICVCLLAALCLGLLFLSPRFRRD